MSSAITHGDLRFANPLDPRTIERLVSAIDLPPGARVLDIGAGRGELLALFGDDVEKIAIEPAPRWAAAARERGIDVVHETTFADAPLDPPYDLVCCVASTHAIGTWLEWPRAVARLGRRALIGDGFWRREPSESYLEVLGGTRDELPDYTALRVVLAAAGWQIDSEALASDADWARYEETLIANGERALAEHDDPDLRAWVDAAKDRWNHPDGKDTLGFALLALSCATSDAEPGPDEGH